MIQEAVELDELRVTKCRTECKVDHSLFSWGLSFTAVPMPTIIASCMVRILVSWLALIGRVRVGNTPMRHEHALFAAEDELLPAHAGDLRVQGLCEG